MSDQTPSVSKNDSLSSTSVGVYTVKTAQTVADVLKHLKMEGKFFAVLCNGKTMKLDDIVNADAELTILPKVAGG